MSKIISLDGDWQMLWDTEDAGISNRWYATYPKNTEKVKVPHIWERAFSKLLVSQDCAFYFKKFTIKDEKQVAKRIFLRFERIATHATVWLNGKLLGTHFGAYTPFIIEPQKILKLGEENMLCVRVANMGTSNSRIDLGRESSEGADDRFVHPSEMPVGKPWLQYPFGGIFGHVDLIMGTAAFISDLKLEPDADTQRVACELSFSNPRGFQTALRVLIKTPEGDVSEQFIKNLKLDKENATQRFVFEIKKSLHSKSQWSPEHPNVYEIEFQMEIKAGKEKDGKFIKQPEYAFSVLKKFGFRKFDCIKGDYYLNDAILKIQGVSYNQQWSKGGLWTLDNNALEADLKAVKAAGFNAIRSCGAPLSNKALDICDKLGLIVFQEFPIYTMRATNEGISIAKKLINDIVQEQHNHPCIGIWVMGSENGTLLLQNGNKLLNAISPVDMMRPVISNINSIYLDNEGSFHKDTGKLLPVTFDKISAYASMRLNPRMLPNAAYTHYLAHFFDKDDTELTVPDTGLGDSHFQDEEENVASDINNKLLVTLKNHTLLPATATTISGPRSAKNQKSIKTFIKAIDTFTSSDKSIWESYKDFIKIANDLSLKSKLDQITALQSNPQIAGFFLDYWADCGIDFSGLCNENRVSKGFEKFAKEITTPSRVLLSEFEHIVAVSSEISFQLTLLNNNRYEKVSVEVKLIDQKGKAVAKKNISPEEQVGKTSLTQLGLCTMVAPRTEGKYSLEITLKNNDEVVHKSTEDLIVIAKVDVKAAMKKVCFLDDNEESSDALAALVGREKIIFTANLSSWPDEILDKLVSVVKHDGKTLLLSDLTQEDIDYLNQSHQFDCSIESHWSTGANELSIHYLPSESPLKQVFGNDLVLDQNAAAIMPSISLNELPGSKIFARSVTLKDGEILCGTDLQLYPFGKGKIMFNQFNVIEGLETNVLADKLFATIVNML